MDNDSRFMLIVLKLLVKLGMKASNKKVLVLMLKFDGCVCIFINGWYWCVWLLKVSFKERVSVRGSFCVYM